MTSFILGDKIKGPPRGFKITIHNHPSTQCHFNLCICVNSVKISEHLAKSHVTFSSEVAQCETSLISSITISSITIFPIAQKNANIKNKVTLNFYYKFLSFYFCMFCTPLQISSCRTLIGKLSINYASNSVHLRAVTKFLCMLQFCEHKSKTKAYFIDLSRLAMLCI